LSETFYNNNNNYNYLVYCRHCCSTDVSRSIYIYILVFEQLLLMIFVDVDLKMNKNKITKNILVFVIVRSSERAKLI